MCQPLPCRTVFAHTIPWGCFSEPFSSSHRIGPLSYAVSQAGTQQLPEISGNKTDENEGSGPFPLSPLLLDKISFFFPLSPLLLSFFFVSPFYFIYLFLAVPGSLRDPSSPTRD